MIQRTLETVGRAETAKVTAFTDGYPGLRAVLATSGCGKPSILVWFHIAMYLQQPRLVAANLSIDDADRVMAKAAIAAEIESPHSRIWNGKAKNAWHSINRIHTVTCFQRENSKVA